MCKRTDGIAGVCGIVVQKTEKKGIDICAPDVYNMSNLEAVRQKGAGGYETQDEPVYHVDSVRRLC